MSTLLFSLNAISPIILTILLGYLIARIKLVSDNFFKEANKLVFNVALPIYLFYSVYNIDQFQSIDWNLPILTASLLLLIFILATFFTTLYTKDPGKRGVLIQNAFRSNYAIIGIPLSQAIGSDNAVAIAAIISAIGIPLLNIFAVITLSIFSYNNESSKISISQILKLILKNPLIIGVFSALICLLIRSYVPFTIKDDIPALYQSIKSVGAIASPLALLVLGGRFKLSAVKELASDITFGVMWRLFITPVITLSICYFLSSKGIVELNATSYPAIITFFCSPVAVSSAIMADSMNCHGELARQLVIWTNIISIFTIFITITICRSIGLF